MSAGDALNERQFELLHRGVGDYNGHRFDADSPRFEGPRHDSAESWWAEAAEDHPNYGTWWDRSPRTAEFYAGGSDGTGVVVSAHFPKSVVKEPKEATGVHVPQGAEGIVHKVRAFDHEGEFELPHKPGFRIRA